jgi:two-component system nitrate/nitrite response regulator NarL
MKEFSSFRIRPYLTIRQRQCLRLLIEGKTIMQIALELGLSARTVHDHLRRARFQLDCFSTLQAAVKADRLGLLNEPKLC